MHFRHRYFYLMRDQVDCIRHGKYYRRAVPSLTGVKPEMRHHQGSLFVTIVLFACFLTAGCGGSGSGSSGSNSGSGGGSTQVSNPAPTLTSLNPASATAGATALSITLTGTNFLSTSTASWNGTPLTTTYKSATSLTAQISADDLQTAGKAAVTVNNPAPGGGASSAITFTINPASNPVPVLTSLNPASAPAGSSGLTITLTGSDFVSASTALWNGKPLTTGYTSATTLTAQVSAADLQTAGDATVEVSSPSPGGGTSDGLTFVVNSTSVQGATVLNVLANDLVWDAVNQKIYLSLPSVDGGNGNSIQVLDPTSGTLGILAFAGSEPNVLSVSAKSQYLYVGLNGASNVQRMTLPNLGKDITIPLGADSFFGPYFAMDVQAAPNADKTVAVVRGAANVAPEEVGGVVIYDDGTARPNTICGFIQSGCTGSGGDLFDSIQWNADASEMFAANDESTGYDFYTVPVTSSGFGKITDYGGVVAGFYGSIHYDKTTGYIYDDDGAIVNPANGTIVGTFAASGLMVPDGTLKRAFFIGQTALSNPPSGTFTLESFDIDHFTPIASVTLDNIVGIPTHLIRWGSNGLAVTTSNEGPGTPASAGGVYIVSGAFVDGTGSDAVAKPTENVHRTWEHRQPVTRLPIRADEVHRTQ